MPSPPSPSPSYYNPNRIYRHRFLLILTPLLLLLNLLILIVICLPTSRTSKSDPPSSKLHKPPTAALSTMPKWDRSSGCPIHPFSLVVCRHPKTKLWLAVEENKDRGWWLPGGFVENTDNHFTAAVRETMEEAGINIKLLGILRIENSMNIYGGRQRVIFYGEPHDIHQEPKSIADEESKCAAWLSIEALEVKAKLPPPEGLRGRELLDWAKYITRGGQIYPLAVLSDEHDPVPIP